ncbi:MAG: PilZ domain protein [Acidobacteria bacterium]|nr:PilZ domain protein [Acidobacteriota bacterium]
MQENREPLPKKIMSDYQRQHIRFSLDIPAIRFTRFGEKQETLLHQISVGGCLAEWDENVFTGDEFRLEIQMQNKNWLPLKCKAVYRFENNGIGIKFLDITRFEQELLARIISDTLASEGLPMQIDPFAQPNRFAESAVPRLTDHRREQEELLERIMSSDDRK